MPTNSLLATRDPRILLDRIKEAFPEVSWSEYKFIDAGWDHEVIQLDNKLIFRFPNSKEYLLVMEDEIRLMDFLSKQTEARIPNYIYAARDFSFGGYPMLQGEALTPEIFGSLHEGIRDIVATDIANFLTDLHSVDLDALSSFNIATEVPSGRYGDEDVLATKFLKPNLSDTEYEQIKTMLWDVSKVKKYKQPSRLTHGDIAPKHLIWDKNDEVVGLIDFSDRSIADPALDFAELYTYGESFVERVYSLYKGPDKHPQFLTRAKAYMKAIAVRALVNVYRSDRLKIEEAQQLLKIGLALEIYN